MAKRARTAQALGFLQVFGPREGLAREAASKEAPARKGSTKDSFQKEGQLADWRAVDSLKAAIRALMGLMGAEKAGTLSTLSMRTQSREVT